MKIYTAILATLLSTQAFADCSSIDWQPSSAEQTGVPANGMAAEPSREDAERRSDYLECMKPDLLIQETIDIDLERVADEFKPAPKAFPTRAPTVAAS